MLHIAIDDAWRPAHTEVLADENGVCIVDPADADAVGRAHGKVFAAVRPASTMIAGAVLLRPEWRVEIEAEAEVGHVG